MGETTFKSPGIKSREIDLTQPTRSAPVGVPAGIIGTSLMGPAFVPITFANYSDFTSVFGKSDGEKFGPITVNQWLSSAESVTYLRVLGAGDGQQRNTTTGQVTNAGFTAGERLTQANGNIGHNPYAAIGGAEGRVYFLGCFMSESNGSTIFSDAGIQIDNKAKPILRGVLLAPSGVILHLSASGNPSSAAPTKGNISTDSTQGGITGSLDLSTQEFVLLMNGYNNSDTSKLTHVTASFDMRSPNYFGNGQVLNTDPLKIEEAGHLLYAQYDIHPTYAEVTGSGIITAGSYSPGSNNTKENIALLLTSSVERGSTAANKPVYEDFSDRYSHAKTPFVISQNFGASPKNLFKIHLLSDGEGPATQYKFSILNIRKSSSTVNQYGTFDLEIRNFYDTDSKPIVLERWSGLSLDPTSDRYIARVIGDQHIYYNFDVAASSQKLVVEGSHPVNSRYIRVEVADEVKEGSIDATALPLGFRGPDHLLTSGSLLVNQPDSIFAVSTATQGLVQPAVPYRENIAIGQGIQKRSDARFYWGLQTNQKESLAEPNADTYRNISLLSFAKHFPNHRLDYPNFSEGNNPGVADVAGTVRDCDRFNNNKFTLENILIRTGSDGLADPDQWLSASYVRNGNIAISDANKTRGFDVDDLGKTANIKFAKFTMFAQGGFDGLNIFNSDKANLTNEAAKREMDDPTAAGVSDSTVTAYRKAIDIMASKDDVDIQLLATPGLRHASVTDYAIQKVENRFDAMYIMDIEERDQFNTVITSSVQKPHVANTVTAFKNRALDTSFAASYFPNVTVTDPDRQTLVAVPPSVAVLGAFALNDRLGHPWTAPAGFTRGALSTVEIPNVKLNRDNLDNLYEANINPIAEYPGQGIVVWGQKTLQLENTALDRINVRRLLVDVRRKVRNVANTLLFEPNREETLERFAALVNPILQSVQNQSGVDRYKVVIDSSTTTQADIENNTLRGKIYLQPTRSVEFVALDYEITNAGSNI